MANEQSVPQAPTPIGPQDSDVIISAALEKLLDPDIIAAIRDNVALMNGEAVQMQLARNIRELADAIRSRPL